MKNWEEILLKPSDKLEIAIQVIHAGGLRIALVVDKNKKLLGTVTDGDIRRALIKHTSMDCPVEEVMNVKPLTALISDNPSLIMLKMKKRDLLSIPLINKQGVLIGLETLQHLIEKKKYDNSVFLMAGGFGTRLHPLTNEKPKPLLNVGNRPILETIINQFIDYGFHNFYISTHYKPEMIRDHFGDGSEWGVTIKYIHEESPLGTAGSLGLLPNAIPKLPIIIMNGDLLTKVSFDSLLDFHCKQEGLATMCIREYDFQVPYGVVSVNGHHVDGIVEKPVHKFFVNAGIYVLDPKLLKSVDGITYIDMPNLLEILIKEGEKISVFPIHEYWLDIGHMKQFESAQHDWNLLK